MSLPTAQGIVAAQSSDTAKDIAAAKSDDPCKGNEDTKSTACQSVGMDTSACITCPELAFLIDPLRASGRLWITAHEAITLQMFFSTGHLSQSI